MVYITVRQSPMYHQMTLEEFLFQVDVPTTSLNPNLTNTRTYEVPEVSEYMARKLNINTAYLIGKLTQFNNANEALRQMPRVELYNNFYTKKKDGGYHAFLKGIFKKQSHYIPCDNGAFYSDVTAALSPLIKQHPAVKHAEIYERAASGVIIAAESRGLSFDRESFDELFSGSFRKIDAPKQELMDALRSLKTIFEQDFRILYHTSAFAYIKKRCTLDAVKRHQANESRWYAKYDLHNFFGSTTLEFMIRMFSMVYPFSEVVKDENGLAQLKTALELATLNGGLPQGTPISPLITNIMMIPVDYKLSNALRNYERQRFVYTRYADDFQISSRYDFSFREIEQLIINTLADFGAPFTINSGKTRYGSSSGANWNLGVMVNKENNITIGHEKKRQFKAMLNSFVLDTVNGDPWDISDVRVLDGYRNYYRMVEKETIDKIVDTVGAKYHVNIPAMIKAQLRT